MIQATKSRREGGGGGGEGRSRVGLFSWFVSSSKSPSFVLLGKSHS